MLVFIDSAGTVVAVYDQDTVPPSAHPGTRRVVLPAGSVTVDENGQLVLAPGVVVDPAASPTMTVTLAGDPVELTWADRNALVLEWAAPNLSAGSITFTPIGGAKIEHITINEAKAAIVALESLRP